MKKLISKYALGDGVELNTTYPNTFPIPSDAEKAQLKVGNLVKLMFIPIDEGEGAVERMWVEITDIDGYYNMIGRLDSQPFLTDCADYGDTVKFRADHIIDIATKSEQRAEEWNCVDCGSVRITAQARDGWLCPSCLDARNRHLEEFVMRFGLPVSQTVDPNGPPTACGQKGCRRDAVVITRLNHGGRTVGVTACIAHQKAAADAVADLLSGQTA